MHRRAISKRQFVIGASAAGLLAPLLYVGGCGNGKSTKLNKRLYGASLVAWDRASNGDPELWRKAVREMYDGGLRRVTLVSFAFVDPDTGEIHPESTNSRDSAPSRRVLLAAADEAASHGMQISIRPWVEAENDLGAGELWRGYLDFEGDAKTQFTNDYTEFVLDLADLAKEVQADRFYIGSELNRLTLKSEYSAFWHDLIKASKERLKQSQCLISYTANYDEFGHVKFWKELDEIGIDAYEPLATPEQSRGAGNPSEKTIFKNFTRFMKRLEKLSKRFDKPVFIGEWGIVPFDTATSDPSNELPSTVVDHEEALTAYRAILNVLSMQGDWLSGVDFWHWSVGLNEDSNYRIEPNSDVSTIIKSAIETGPEHKI